MEGDSEMKYAMVVALAVLAALSASAQTGGGDYRIGPKDLLEIRVLEIPELNVERRVSASGSIELPMLGELAVSGQTEAAVKARIETLLRARFVNRANASVVVKELASSPISVIGAITRPGPLNVSGKWTLLQAIAAAGGVTERAGKKIYVIRTAPDGGTQVLEIPTDELLRGASAKWNVPIFPSDVINIPARTTLNVLCLGEVHQPGSLEFDSDDRVTLLSAIAKAGGLTERASNQIRIRRRSPDGHETEIVVDYGRIAKGKLSDVVLEPDDAVIVKLAFF
jgi:polysaccharide export outer membrane protein